MSTVQILPEDLINKIAAGEVVERPASVVKELVENAIDAGADQIFVTLADGGKQLISVLDNGAGMSPEDAQLAVQRHATSKIAIEADLEKIASLGFRGEALAAISSVSRFELVTCHDEAQGGFQLKIEGGKPPKTASLGFPKGTKITVADLFFNQPARLKFLKSVKTEYHHIFDLILRLAIAHPQIQFKLTHDKNLVLNLPKGQDLLARIADCYGTEIASELVAIEYEESYLKFRGYFSHPASARSSKRWQHAFVNHRWVRNKTLTQAVYEGYKTLLMKNMHPMFFMEIQLDPRELDVNVHPAKTEIRLRNTTLVHTILSGRLQRALKEASRRRFFSPEDEAEAGGIAAQGVQERMLPSGALPPGPGKLFVELNDQIGFEAGPPLKTKPEPIRPQRPIPGRLPSPPLETTPTQAPEPEESAFSFNSGSDFARPQPTHLGAGAPVYSAIGQLGKKYILAQGAERLILVDQHSAHERIRFEEIRGDFYAKKLESHSLIIPLLVELPPQDGLLLEQHLPQFAQLGFVIEPFGGNDYSVKEVPSILKDKDVGALLKEVLDEMSQFGRSGKMEIFFNEVFEKIACHSAIRAGQSLSLPEMQSLLNQLASLDLQIHCPHGRPVLVEISLTELDKRFKRIV
ncbi:MAG: DNA mismatch repair endonuclease MutL [bacterium]|nr:DNA mismatch repair endonuclease MutL [bacterium]